MEHKVILHDTVYTNDSFLDIPIDITKQVSIGASVVEKFAEELDIGRLNITHSLREKEYNMFSLIEIILYKNKEEIKRFDLFIENDEVTPINKKGKRYYRHEIRLIELTHILDQSLINTLNFTQPLLGRHLAPFEQQIELYYEGEWEPLDLSSSKDAVNNLAKSFTIVMDKPDIMNRYQGKVKISKVNKAKLQFTSSLEEDYQDVTIEDVELKVYSIIEDAFGTYEEVLVPGYSMALSNSDFEENMSRGRYRFELSTEGFVDSDFGNTEFLRNIRRKLSFYVGVDAEAYTMLDVVNRIINTSPLEKQSQLALTRKIQMSSELADRLEKITAPQMLLKELTTREGINEALKYVNSVCRLVREGSLFKIVENHFNTRNEPYNIGEIFSFSSEKNTLEYSTSLRSYLKRTISNNSNNTPSVKTPSAKDFEGYRSETLQVLPDTPKIFLSEPIYRLIKVSARITYTLPFYGGNETEDKLIQDYEIDITPRIMEKKEFNLRRAKLFVTGEALLGTFSMPRKNYLRNTQGEFATYDYLGKEIDFTPKGVDLVGFFQAPYYMYVLTAGLYEEMAFMQGRRTEDFGIFGENNTAYKDTYSAMPPYIDYEKRFFSDNTMPETADEQRVSNIELRVEYITMSNTVQSSQRENTETMFLETMKKINQNSRITNFEKSTKQGYGLAQRYGVQTINFSKLTKYPKSLPNPGDFNDNNELIVEKETVLHKNHVIGKFEASRDFNRFSKYVGIDREYRYSEIPDPTNSEDRVEIYEEFLEYYTGSEPTTINNDTYISSLFIETMVNTLVQDPAKNKIGVSNALIRTDGTKENYPDKNGGKKYITIPTVSMGGKNLLSFGFRFNDNKIAGDIVDFNDIFGIIDEPYGLWQEYVEYTKTDGTFDTLDFNLVNAIPKQGENRAYNRTRTLPLIDYNPETTWHQMEDISFASTDNIGVEDPLMIFKDQGERFGLVYQVSFVPRDKEAREDIIFGTNFTSFNFLVNGKQEDKYLYTYNDNTRYFKFDDQIIKKPYAHKIPLSASMISEQGLVIGFEISGATFPTATTSWAIGNDNGDLDIANNTTNNNVIFVPRNKRRDVKYTLLEYQPYDIYGTSSNVGITITTNITNEIPEYYEAEISVNFSATYESASGGGQETKNATIETSFTVGDSNSGQIYIPEIAEEAITVLFNGSYSMDGFGNETTNEDINVNFLPNITTSHFVSELYNAVISSSLTIGSEGNVGTEYIPEQANEELVVAFGLNANSNGVEFIPQETSEILTVNFSLNANGDGYLDYNMEWTSGGTSPSGENKCSDYDDKDNVRCDIIDYEKEWQTTGVSGEGVPEGTYYTTLPSTDNFEEGDKIKVYRSMLDAWQEYELVLVPVYGNCEICSVVI